MNDDQYQRPHSALQLTEQGIRRPRRRDPAAGRPMISDADRLTATELAAQREAALDTRPAHHQRKNRAKGQTVTADPMHRIHAVKDSLRAKVASAPTMNHNGFIVDDDPDRPRYGAGLATPAEPTPANTTGGERSGTSIPLPGAVVATTSGPTGRSTHPSAQAAAGS